MQTSPSVYDPRMRIVVSGTHASGKTTLIGEFAAAHPSYVVWDDPFEAIEDSGEEPDAGGFFAQLLIAADRLCESPGPTQLVAERGPLDFLAYLAALESLERPTRSNSLFRRGIGPTRRAMAHVDLIALLPLDARHVIDVPPDEDPELRLAMNDALLDLADDPDLTGAAVVIELVGGPAERCAQLDEAIERFASSE